MRKIKIISPIFLKKIFLGAGKSTLGKMLIEYAEDTIHNDIVNILIFIENSFYNSIFWLNIFNDKGT